MGLSASIATNDSANTSINSTLICPISLRRNWIHSYKQVVINNPTTESRCPCCNLTLLSFINHEINQISHQKQLGETKLETQNG